MAPPLRAQQPVGAMVAHSAEQTATPAAQGAPSPANGMEGSGPSTGSQTAGSHFSLNNLAWLQGEWDGSWGPRMAHQSWTAPHAGTMLGTLQIVEGGKTLVVEMVALSESPTGVEYRLLHFTPALAPWETTGPTVLSLSTTDSKRFVFDNLSDGQPREIVFTRLDPDTYKVRSDISPASGDPLANEISFHRQKAAPPKKK